MVRRIAPARPIGMIVCTEPLPNDRVPISVARRWSCRAPATISDAEAEPPLIKRDKRLAVDEVAGARAEALHLVGVTAARRDDLAVVDEGVRDEHRLVEQAARVAAEIEDEALQLVGRDACESIVSIAFSRPSIVCSLKEAMRI